MSGDDRIRNQPSGLAAARAARDAQAPVSGEMEILLRRVERERQARKQAEQLLERKSLELYESNQRLQAQAAKLEIAVQERTRALEDAAARMQEALRTKGEFLAVVSHEIRTPMNGVLGMAQLLQMTDLTEEQQRYVETIQTSGETLLTIINDILDVSKLDAGSVRLDNRPVELRAAVKEVVDLLSTQAQKKSLYLDVEIGADVPAWIRGDATRLKQILTNLVGNALKFTHAGGVRIGMSTLQQGQVLQCQVQDTGIGIPPDKVDRLFEKFSQIDSSITRRYGGTGLGLVICKRLVEGMGGQIRAASKQREGSTFTFVIPLVPADEPGKQAKAAQKALKATNLKILLVEDNAVNQMLALGMLQKLGLNADLATDGAEAVERVRDTSYDLILMDMQMPRMDGLTATRAIRSMPDIRQPRIVALTANAMESDRDACLAAGMDDFLSKPFKAAELQDKLVAPPVAGKRDRAA
jgi:signal transduction histidine kinase/ActR/RegA family two-component response regulator